MLPLFILSLEHTESLLFVINFVVSYKCGYYSSLVNNRCLFNHGILLVVLQDIKYNCYNVLVCCKRLLQPLGEYTVLFVGSYV